VALFIFLTVLTACGSHFQTMSSDLASTARDSLGCESLRSKVFDTMYDFLEKNQASPNAKELQTELRQAILDLKSQRNSIEQVEMLASQVVRVYSILADQAKNKLGAQTYREHLRILIQLEMENQSTPAHVELGVELADAFAKINILSKSLALSCGSPAAPAPTPTPTPAPSPTDPPASPPKSLAQFGARFAFATAYQSCQVLSLPDMTANTEDVIGIGKGKDIGGGFQRFYQSLSDIQNTHYYIRNIDYAKSCIQVRQQPLVYDFGGEPAVEPARLNFFVNAGDGGSALGLDCSAFISSALAAAGLKYTPQVSNKSIFVRQLSRDFIDPQLSGWKCFDRVAMLPQQSLQEGDILAVAGHVVMVDKVGSDPFGLGKINNIVNCSTISFKDFDFTVLQSSPSKGSIGINRYVAKDYLAESDKMRVGFETYAKAACQAHFGGVAISVSDNTVGLIRHKQTAECIDKKVELAGQSCIENCRELASP
jgi:hypothetical protein